MDGSLGKIPSQMLGDKCQPQGQKLTLVSLDPSKSGVKVQLPHPHRAPQSTMSTMSMSSPGVTLTVSPNPQLGMKSRSLTSAPGSRLEVHDPKTKTVILTSPCIKWIKSGQNLKVINLPLGLVPSLNVCRLPNAKGIVISRPTNLNQIIIHKEAPVQRRPESLHRNPGLPVPWRGQVTPIVFSAAPSPVVLSISQAAGTSSTGGGTGVREAVASLPINNGYSRGVYENFRKWQQYKGLVRKHFALTPDTEAVACFFIPVLRSLSQFKPQLSTEEGIPLAVQEWRKLSNFDRMIYYEMAEKFMEFELEEQAQQLQCEQVPVQSGLSQGVQILSGVTGKSNKQILEDPGGKKCNSKGTSQRSHKQAKVAPQAGSTSGPRQLPIPIEAINQYIGIMEALTEDQQMEGEAFPEPIEDQGNEEPELIKYIEKLCSKDCFISKAEAIIHPEFLSNLLSPNGNMDFPRLIKELEMEEHLSAAELERRRDSTQEENFWQTEASDPRPPTDYRPRALSPSTLPSEAAQPLQGLLLPPLDGPCPYSSRLQRLALQSASDRASPTEAPATLVSAAEAPAHRLQQARHVLLHELQGKASPRGLAEVGQPQARNLSPDPELQAAGIERTSHNPMPPGATVGEPASPAEEEEEEEAAPGVPAPEAQPQPQQQASAPALAQPQASPGLHAPASSQLPGDAPPVQLPFLDAGDAHCPAWGPRDGRDLGEGPSSTAKAQGEACPVRPDPSTPYRGPTDAPRPLRSSKKLPAVKPAATASLSRVRTRQQKRSSSGTTIRRSKRVKKN